MKVERSTSSRAVRAAGAAAYARRIEPASGADAADALVPTTILGIPESEFTPRVRDKEWTSSGGHERRQPLH